MSKVSMLSVILPQLLQQVGGESSAASKSRRSLHRVRTVEEIRERNENMNKYRPKKIKTERR
jgi:hypothetical protein